VPATATARSDAVNDTVVFFVLAVSFFEFLIGLALSSL